MVKRFEAVFSGTIIGRFGSLDEAQECIQSHPGYKKTWYGKKGNATPKNPDPKAWFRIWDNDATLLYRPIR